MVKPILDRDDLEEIVRGMLGEDGRQSRPRQKLLRALGKASGQSEREIRYLFSEIYSEITGQDDLFDPDDLLIG